MSRNPRKKTPSITSRIERRFLLLTGKKYIHFLHIGKTGGSAIKFALQPYQRYGKYVICLHSHSFKLHDVPDGEKVFFFLRDPVSRFISGFFSRQRQGQPHAFFPWSKEEEKAFQIFSTPDQLASELSSDDPIRLQIAINAMENIRHVNTHYWDWFIDQDYFISRSKDILLIGYQESLSSDFERLKQILKLPEELRLPGDDTAAHKRTGPTVEISQEAINNLKVWYQKDYEFLDFIHEFSAKKSD